MMTRRPFRLGYFRIRNVRVVVVGRLVLVYNPDARLLDKALREGAY